MNRILEGVLTAIFIYFAIQIFWPLILVALVGLGGFILYNNYKYKKEVQRFSQEANQQYTTKQDYQDVNSNSDIIEADFTVVEEKEESYVSQK